MARKKTRFCVVRYAITGMFDEHAACFDSLKDAAHHAKMTAAYRVRILDPNGRVVAFKDKGKRRLTWMNDWR